MGCVTSEVAVEAFDWPLALDRGRLGVRPLFLRGLLSMIYGRDTDSIVRVRREFHHGV